MKGSIEEVFKECPKHGYTKHNIVVGEHCRVTFCVKCYIEVNGTKPTALKGACE